MAYSERRTIRYAHAAVTGDPNRDALICALKAAEQHLGERRGWDQPPRLFTAYLRNIDTCTMELRPIPGLAWRHGLLNPADDLVTTARRAPEPSKLPTLDYADAPDGIAAVVFMSEVWAILDEAQLTADDHRRRAAGERIVHEHPNRVEARSIIAVDINGHSYNQTRLRAHAPEPMVLTTAFEAFPDRVTEALRRLAHAARTTGWPNHT